jgi:O-antigen ligase
VLFVVYDLSKRFSHRPWIVTLPLIAVGIAQASIGLVQASSSTDSIATGTYAIRNHYAGLLEMILPFMAVLGFAASASWESMANRHGVAKILLVCVGVALTGLLFAAILSSLSRMGFVASFASLVFIATVELTRRLPSNKAPWAIVTTVGVTVLLVVLLPSAQLVARFGDLEKYGNDRSPAWRDTLKLIEAYPVVGCGLGAYESSFLEFKNSAPALTQDYAHNDYLQYLAEMGVVGFTIAIVPLGAIIFKLLRGLRNPRSELSWLSVACAASLLAIGIHSCVDFNLYVPANLFVFAWILGISAYVGEHEKLGRRPRPTFAMNECVAV